MEKDTTPTPKTSVTFKNTSHAKKHDAKSAQKPSEKAKDISEKRKRTLSIKSCDTLREMVSCSICLEKLVKPKMLPCQHTFCLLCLQNCLNHDATKSASPVAVSGNCAKISCPQCRVEADVPSAGLSGLPSNIYIQSLLDLFESDNIGKEIVQCNSCQTVCIDCSPCQHCQTIFCSPCQESHVNKLRNLAEEIAGQLEVCGGQLLKKADIFQNECSDLKSKIKLESQLRVQKIKSSEESLLETVAEEEERESDNIQSAVTMLKDNVSAMRNSFPKKFDALTSPAEKVTLFLEVHKQATEILSGIPKLGLTKLEFDPDLFSIRVDRKVESEMEALGPTSSFANLGRESPDGHTTNEQSRFYRARSFALKSKIGIGIVQRPAGVAVCPWSREIYVVSMDSHKVNIFDRSGKFLRSFGSRGQNPGEFLCPFGVAFSMKDKKIFVTDKWKNCINEYDEGCSFTRQMGLKGRSPGHFRSPEGIATDASGKIYVCDTGNDRLQVLDCDGTFMLEVGVKNTMEAGTVRQKSFFNQPTGVAVTPDGERIVVCDYGHHKVRVFTVTSSVNGAASAELSLTLGTKGQLKGQFYNPECVAVDAHGFMLIGDSGNSRLQICRPDGKVIRTFGNSKGGASGHFSWISGIAVTQENDIIVSDFKNHCVKVF